MTDRDNCTLEVIKEFDKLNYKNKIIFTNKKLDNIKSCVYVHGYDKCEEIGILTDYCGILGKRYYDKFDYVKWFNSK